MADRPTLIRILAKRVKNCAVVVSSTQPALLSPNIRDGATAAGRGATAPVAGRRMFHSMREPNFVYQGWHARHGGPTYNVGSNYHSVSMDAHDGSTFDAKYKHDAMEEIPPSQLLNHRRVMSPKASSEEQNHETAWDEDYDEYTLHIPPHRVANRCQTVQGNLDAMDDRDLFRLHCDTSTPEYTWKVVPPPNRDVFNANLYGDNADHGVEK